MSQKSDKTLATIPIGQTCRIHELGGAWRVISDDVTHCKVQNTKDAHGENILRLPKTTFLQK